MREGGGACLGPRGAAGLTARRGRPPGHHLAVPGTHVGVGGDDVAEAGTVPDGFAGAGVVDASIQVRLGVHLQGRHRWPGLHLGTLALGLGVNVPVVRGGAGAPGRRKDVRQWSQGGNG